MQYRGPWSAFQLAEVVDWDQGLLDMLFSDMEASSL